MTDGVNVLLLVIAMWHIQLDKAMLILSMHLHLLGEVKRKQVTIFTRWMMVHCLSNSNHVIQGAKSVLAPVVNYFSDHKKKYYSHHFFFGVCVLVFFFFQLVSYSLYIKPEDNWLQNAVQRQVFSLSYPDTAYS